MSNQNQQQHIHSRDSIQKRFGEKDRHPSADAIGAHPKKGKKRTICYFLVILSQSVGCILTTFVEGLSGWGQIHDEEQMGLDEVKYGIKPQAYMDQNDPNYPDDEAWRAQDDIPQVGSK